MKKILIIMLMVIYGFSTMGMTINLHYCCGKLERVDLTSASTNKGDHEMGLKGCCEIKQISNKEKSDQENYILTVKAFKSFSATNSAFTAINTFKPDGRPGSSAPHSSPPFTKRPVFILICDFRL